MSVGDHINHGNNLPGCVLAASALFGGVLGVLIVLWIFIFFWS